MSERVLITGADGQLAGAIAEQFDGSGELLRLSRGDLDITNHADVERTVASFDPALIINCAAYNLVDRAEDEPQAAISVNAFGPKVLARAAAAHGAKLVHYSSDFVFDGRADSPYTEQDTPSPVSVYGSSKLLGEWFALEAPRALVLRVASLYGGVRAKSSVDRIIDALLNRREAPIFTDRTTSPSYVEDVATATRALVNQGASGLYHCVGTGHCTWYELGIEVARVLSADVKYLVPTSSESVKLRAQRPKYAALSNAKISNSIAMPTWKDAIARYLKKVRSSSVAPPSRR